MKAKKQAVALLREKSNVENSMRQQLKAIRSLLIPSSSPHYADLATAFNNVSAPRFHRFYGHFEQLTGQYFGAPFAFIPYETSDEFLDRLCKQSLTTLIENNGRLKGVQGEVTPDAGRAWAEVRQVVDSKAGGGGIVGILVQKRSAVDNRRGWSFALGCPSGAALAAALKPLCDALTESWEDQVRRERGQRDRSSPTAAATAAAAAATDLKLQLLSGETLSYFQASGSGPQAGPAAAAAAVAMDPPTKAYPMPIVPLVIPPPRISAPGQLEGSAEAHRPVRARRPPTPPPQGSAAAEGPGPSPVARQANRGFSLRIRIGSQISAEPTDNNNSNKRKADKLPNQWSELEAPQGPPQADGLKRAASVPGEWLRGALSDSLDFGLDTSKSHGYPALNRDGLALGLQGFRDGPANKASAAADANAALELGLPTAAASLRGNSRESLIEPLVQEAAPALPTLPPPVFTGVDHFLASMGIDVGGRPSLHAATPGEGAGASALEEEDLLMDIDTDHDLGLFSNDPLPTFSPRWDIWPGLKDMGSLGSFPADLADMAPVTARRQFSEGFRTKSLKSMPTPVPPPPGPTFAQMAEIPDLFTGDLAGK